MKSAFPSSLFRRSVQTILALYCIYIGYRFHGFMQWVGGNGPQAVRPPSVEAFLPISALMGLKRLVLSGVWDNVHPAGLVVLVAAIAMAVLFRKGFCGYICPVGFASNILEALGKKMSLALTPPRWPDRLLASLKYILLTFFLYTTLSMPLAAINRFLMSPYNLTADARMLAFFTSPSSTALIVLAALAVLGIVVKNFWCRYLCPYGALLGLFSWLSPLAVNRDESACISCGQCARACPSSLRVDQKIRVDSPECIGCAACIEACPVQGCLSLRAGYIARPALPPRPDAPTRKPFLSSPLPLWTIGGGCLALLLLSYLLAEATGHWSNGLPSSMLRMLYLRT